MNLEQTTFPVRSEAEERRVWLSRAHMSASLAPLRDAVIATTHEIEDGVELYAPRIQVDAAISRHIKDRSRLRELMQPLSSHPNVWVMWYRARESAVLDVGKELWGALESNNPGKPIGSLRVIRFQPGTTTGTAESDAGAKP